MKNAITLIVIVVAGIAILALGEVAYVPKSLKLAAIAGIVACLCTALIVLIRVGLSDKPPKSIKKITKAIGTLTLAEGTLFFTDDPSIHQHIEHLAGLEPGEYAVEVSMHVDSAGHEEWMTLTIRRGQLQAATATDDLEAVVDSGFLLFGCPSILTHPMPQNATEAMKAFIHSQDKPFEFVRTGDGSARLLLIASPNGDGTYPLRIFRNPGGTALTLSWQGDEN